MASYDGGAGLITEFITGGTYSTDPTAYLAKGYVATEENGVYTVKEGEYIATVNGVKYETLQAAINAANAGDTVTLLADVTGAGVVINKDIVIDFAGYTYTVNEAVGSTGTATLGMQILKGNDVTLKNGTFAASETVVEGSKAIKMLIQNYANLTIEDMDLIGASTTLYVVSNNSGNVAITGETNITATDGNVAFDVYDYSSAGYAVPVVSVDTTGTITGKIEVSDTATLAISGGTYTVALDETWCAEGFTPVDNGDGTYGVTEKPDVLWGDVNGDEIIDATDATLLTRYANKWAAITYADATNLDAGDVNGDNVVDATDATLLTRYANKWAAITYAEATNLLAVIG